MTSVRRTHDPCASGAGPSWNDVTFSRTVWCAVLGLWGLLGLSTLFLLSRRLTGAMQSSAPTISLIGLLGFLAALTWLTRKLVSRLPWGVPDGGGSVLPWPKSGEIESRIRQTIGHALHWLPAICAAGLGFALTWPMERAIDWFVWLILLSAAGIAVTTRRPNLAPGQPLDPQDLGAMPDGETCENAPRVEGALAELTTQSWERVQSEDGSESVFATLQSEVPVGGRRTTLHLSFCPPFAAVPQVEAEQVAGPAASTKISQVLPHGASIDIRLHDVASKPTLVGVEVAAWLS